MRIIQIKGKNMEQNSEQEECEFMANLELMHEYNICLKVSIADIQFGDDMPVVAFHIACIGRCNGVEAILMHGMCRKAEGLQQTMKDMAAISAELCRLCASRKVIGVPVFEEDEMEDVIRNIMHKNGMDIEQLCRPQEAPKRESWMFN